MSFRISRRVFAGVVTLAAVALVVAFAAAAATPPSGVTSNGFETNTAGWFDNDGTITQRPNGYVNLGGYASGINAADGSYFAGLDRGPCYTDTRGSGPSLLCSGPYTDWGNLNNYTWNGPYTTQVDIYLDVAYANAHPDVYNGNTRDGNIAGLSLDATPPGTPEDPTVPGTRFDFTSAINSSTPDSNGNAQHLRDFGFNVSTGTADDGCSGFVIDATTNVQRQGANPNASSTRQCIDQTGWYTFKNSFSENASHNLKVVMEIIPQGTNTDHPTWTIENTDPITNVGCNRYGWFADQEIYGLPIDNAKIEGGCATAVISGGQIAPTGTTCQAYNAGTAATLDQVLYTLKNGNINSVSPGVFFYYGKISGTADQKFTITQSSDPTGAPVIPIQHGQVILYDTNCNVVKWQPDSDASGVVTGTLPSTGDFIISVKYSPADLKGESNPATVTYTIDGATVTLAPKK